MNPTGILRTASCFSLGFFDFDFALEVLGINTIGAGERNRTAVISLEGWDNSHYTTPACV